MSNRKGKRGRRANHIDDEIGARLRGFRVEAGMSMQELGPLVGITYQQLQKYEVGINRISAGRLLQVATILDVPIERFYEGIKV